MSIAPLPPESGPFAVNAVFTDSNHDCHSPFDERLTNLLSSSDYCAAIDVLRTSGSHHDIRDALGVCLMRSCQYQQAIEIYRQLVLQPGSTRIRDGIDNRIKINFATALLLAGLPSGALDVLNKTQDPFDLQAVRIRLAIRSWAKSLSFWRRLDWHLNHIEPPKTVVLINFLPGAWPMDCVPVHSQPPHLDPSKFRKSLRLAA
jgi:hypothetical protein